MNETLNNLLAMENERIRRKIYSELWKMNGKDNQLLKAVEESGELTTALARFSTIKSKANVEALIDEVADMKIILEQLTQELNIDSQVKERYTFKLQRLQERIKTNKLEKTRGKE